MVHELLSDVVRMSAPKGTRKVVNPREVPEGYGLGL
jgi:hypothetical protein